MKKKIFTLVLTAFLSACGYSPENVRVSDIYSGKKIALLEKMSEDERNLLTKYMARKTILLKKFDGDKKVFDSREIGNNEFSVDAKDEHLISGFDFSEVNGVSKGGSVVITNDDVSVVSMDLENNQRLEVVVIRPNTEGMKKILGSVTVKDAIVEQIEYENKFKLWLEDLVDKKAKQEEEYNKQKELSSKLRVLLVEKYKASDNELEFTFAFTNARKKAVVAFRGIIEFYDNDGNKFYQMLVQDETGIKPRDLLSYDGDFVVDLTKPDEKKLMDINEDDITLKFVVTDVLYDDGEVFGADDFKEMSKVLVRANEIMKSDDVSEDANSVPSKKGD